MWLEWVAVASIALVVYSYLLYPLTLMAVAAVAQLKSDAGFVWRKAERRRRAAPVQWPAVAIVISAFNEERHIGPRIANLLSLDYPPELLRCYIGSDGSQDGTGRILDECRDSRVRTFVFTDNRGKASVLNDLVGRTSESILIFSDANTFFDPQAVRRLVAHFQDPSVGGVSGELRLRGSGGDNQDSLYWRVEQLLKFFESRIGGLLGANGAIYGIRRALWQPLRPDTICDDFCIAMNVTSASRLVYEPTAWAEEETPDNIADEYGRRVRIGIGNFQALCRHPEYFLKSSWATRFTYISHKVLRWIAPHLLLIGLAASFYLGLGSFEWMLFAVLQAMAYVGSAWLYALSKSGARLPGLAKIMAFLFALNWAFLVASWRYATHNYSGGAWRRTSR